MKSLTEWEESEQDLLDYIKPLDEIDEELFLHCGGIVAPQYCTRDFLQMGEAEFDKDGVYHYATFATINRRHYYLGVLPELMQ